MQVEKLATAFLFISYLHSSEIHPPGREAKKYVILNEVKNPIEELTGIYSSLKSWDISLALNMTYFYFHVILNGSEESH